MPIFEIALVISVVAIVVSLILLLGQRRTLSRQLESQRQDMQANQLAVYGMAKHVRGLQKAVDSNGRARSANLTSQQVPTSQQVRDSVDSSPEQGSSTKLQRSAAEQQMDNAERLISAGADTARLADELGVSRTEAEIIAHIRPLRSAGGPASARSGKPVSPPFGGKKVRA
ncbi:MAG: hypothetical protein ACI81O_000416 [Cyclobacteriaceae bacterium]|jgi:hypothetical protein